MQSSTFVHYWECPASDTIPPTWRNQKRRQLDHTPVPCIENFRCKSHLWWYIWIYRSNYMALHSSCLAPANQLSEWCWTNVSFNDRSLLEQYRRVFTNAVGLTTSNDIAETSTCVWRCGILCTPAQLGRSLGFIIDSDWVRTEHVIEVLNTITSCVGLRLVRLYKRKTGQRDPSCITCSAQFTV